MNISATSGPITITFYLKHHWGGGKAALGFGPDRIITLVSMATDSSHRVIMGKTVLLFLGCFSSEPFILTGNDDMHESSDEFRSPTVELAATERHRLIMGKTVLPLFIGCS